MQFNDVQVQRLGAGDGYRAVVTFRGTRGETIVVSLPHSEDQITEDSGMLVGSARAALLDAVSATEGEDPLPLSDVEVDASGRALETPVATPSLEEEDDNPYQQPDEALPDSEEESDLLRNPSQEKGRFGEG
ncbi:hypothetical protein [Chelativorans salis]|uniref:Uncharacterized protein n=1 Tax=Chelativorans salis TaxID=2978478 RepID=A0ABT2LSC6_9HYPH|nr:hypothetical protein [Chelativorans sp. EGI FJ00035]MCT7377420.1 hypothetical protein [Chelativorans sp. EGI FJ00035]